MTCDVAHGEARRLTRLMRSSVQTALRPRRQPAAHLESHLVNQRPNQRRVACLHRWPRPTSVLALARATAPTACMLASCPRGWQTSVRRASSARVGGARATAHTVPSMGRRVLLKRAVHMLRRRTRALRLRCRGATRPPPLARRYITRSTTRSITRYITRSITRSTTRYITRSTTRSTTRYITCYITSFITCDPLGMVCGA